MIAKVVLLLIISCLSIYVYLIRKDIKKIISQLNSSKIEKNQLVSVDLIDPSVNSLVEAINRKILEQRLDSIDMIKRENDLKETVSNISHDLRTPLTAIIGYLQLLKIETISEEHQEYIRIGLEKSLLMKELTHSFFELSYFEAKNIELNFKDINLSNLLIDEVLHETVSFEEKSIIPTMEIREECWVSSDEKLLIRLLQNLIANVIQHGEKFASFTLTHDQDENVVLTITNQYDDMVKINPDKLFQRFYISENSRSGQGNGLGLSIVKLLAEKLSIKVSALIENSTFVVRLEFEKKSNK